MNPVALLVALLIGIFWSWSGAFIFIGGYLFAFLLGGFVKGWMRSRGNL